jgi:hypothetical protein
MLRMKVRKTEEPVPGKRSDRVPGRAEAGARRRASRSEGTVDRLLKLYVLLAYRQYLA